MTTSLSEGIFKFVTVVSNHPLLQLSTVGHVMPLFYTGAERRVRVTAAATRQAAIRAETDPHPEVIAAIMESHFPDEERQLLTVLPTLVPDADLRELLGPL